MNKRAIGAAKEELAANFLIDKGYRIIGRNVRNKCGEIDIIALNPDNLIVFAEVKYRSSDKYGDPAEAVDIRKIRKISKTAVSWMISVGKRDDLTCRFDVIALYGDGHIRHIENAFPYTA